MEDNIKVSVVIPVYQVEDYLERAVDAALNQTLAEKEIILVDDGSTDASPAICDRYAAQYPDLVRVIHKENEGLGLARNAGAQLARGEYIAFLDSDDTVEPEAYEEMYKKAREEDFDLVMCDVRIIYVEENRSTVVPTYAGDRIELSDYLVSGNNITYSVNKLFRRSIWEENQYEKMLFEDISLIPALVTRYPHIGYVKKPFYNYYRRANTISTTFRGDMVDIVQAFRNFLERSDPAYRQEAVYNAAKQFYWNMTQSRTLFQADFIELLKEYEKDFLLNPYIEKDGKIRRLLDFIKKDVIPEIFICVHMGRPVPREYADALRQHFPKARLIQADEGYFPRESLPESVRRALAEGRTAYAEEYYALRILYREGGMVLDPEMRAGLGLKRLRLDRVFFGFKDEEEICTGCYGALKGHYVIRALLDSYEEDNIYNKALAPLGERLRDFLILHFELRVTGRRQMLKNEVQMYLPSVLVFDMQDGDNCCKWVPVEPPEGMELVGRGALKMWSDRLMENWNLYKQELGRKRPAGEKPAPPPLEDAPLTQAYRKELEQRVQEVADTYERSTSWRITRPLRALGRLFGR